MGSPVDPHQDAAGLALEDPLVWTHSCSAACWEPSKASMFKMSPPEMRKHFVPGLFLHIVLRAKQKSCYKGLTFPIYIKC